LGKLKIVVYVLKMLIYNGPFNTKIIIQTKLLNINTEKQIFSENEEPDYRNLLCQLDYKEKKNMFFVDVL
jgi:hypothetical protein